MAGILNLAATLGHGAAVRPSSELHMLQNAHGCQQPLCGSPSKAIRQTCNIVSHCKLHSRVFLQLTTLSKELLSLSTVKNNITMSAFISIVDKLIVIETSDIIQHEIRARFLLFLKHN